MELLKNNLDNIETQNDLFGNKVEKLSMIDRIGFLPISVWKPDWNKTKELKKIIGDSGQARLWDKKSKNFRSSSYGTKISVFNPHLAQMILSAYCPQNANIYDAFGGGGTRGFIASSMGHNYTGIEIREEEIDRILKQQKKLNIYFNIIHDDSRFYNIKECSFNFSYICPPYYNMEIYSDMEGDISNANTYERFLEMIEQSLKINYKGLKNDCLSVWVVGNFRDNHGDLIHFNGDMVRLGQKVGFKLHDELIFWGASNASSMRCGSFVFNRKGVRVHEYIIIFRK